MSLKDALSAAIYSHNLQVNQTGFSPRQITFGQQGVVPGITAGTPASMEPAIESDAVRKLLSYRQQAEEIYRKVDSSERLQKAMAQQTYGYQDEVYQPGDSVFYKEEGKDRWAGPAKVTGVEGNKVRVIHSGYDRTVPKCRVMPTEVRKDVVIDEAADDEEADKDEEEDKCENIESDKASNKETGDNEFETNKIEVRPKRHNEIKYTFNGQTHKGKVIKVGKPNGKDKFRCWIKKNDGSIDNLDFNKDVTSWKVVKNVNIVEEPIEDTKDEEASKENDHLGIFFLVNKKDIDQDTFENDDDVNASFPVLIPTKYHDHPDIVKAKEAELEKWKKYEAYVEVDENDATNPITTRWVITDKGETEKARLCVRGFEEDIYPRSDSPTASGEAMKLFLAISANKSFNLKSLDVTSAFLQGETLERDVYVIPPPEARKYGKIWKLRKSAYGLYDASRKWFLAVKAQLLEMGMKSVSGDDAVFSKHDTEGNLTGMCILHVDDFLVGGTEAFEKLLNLKLKRRFTFGRTETGSFKFTGLNIEQKKSGISVDQIEFIQSLKPIQCNRVGSKNEKLNQTEFKAYRGLTGQLSWAAQNTRPDIAYDARDLATRNKNATLEDLKHANKILKKAQKDDIRIKYSKLGHFQDTKIVGYTDASFRNTEDSTKSVAGRVLFLVDCKTGKCSPISWKSKTIQQVCKSVKSAETRSLDLGMEEGIFQAQMFYEIMTGKTGNQIPVCMKTDSKTLYDSLKSTKQVEEKTIRHLIAWQKQQIEEKNIDKVDWVCSEDMLADVLTKKNVQSESILKVFCKGSLF